MDGILRNFCQSTSYAPDEFFFAVSRLLNASRTDDGGLHTLFGNRIGMVGHNVVIHVFVECFFGVLCAGVKVSFKVVITLWD